MYDVIVLGGGPSGSTAANLLARAGQKTLVLERETFPRFHIGESLLPCDLEVFERLGVSLDGYPQHLYKGGAEFFEESEGLYAEYPFEDSLEGTRPHAFQVERATFDHMLLETARTRGAEVREGERVRGVKVGDDFVEVDTEHGKHRGRYVIDATGQDSFLARQYRSRRPIMDFGLAAVFGHFEDLAPEVVTELESTGNIKILFVDEGWMWAIPLGRGRLSVGLVTRKKGITPAWLGEAIDASPLLSRLLEGAEREGAPRLLSSFSFHNDRPHGARFTCVGDAACFLDPVFSSGVSLGMVGAAHAVDALLPALEEGREGDPALMVGHHAHMIRGYNVFATLIWSFYQRRLLPGIFFTIDQKAELRRGLTTVLAGEVWREDNAFQEMLWAAPRRRYDLASMAGPAEG